MASNNKIKYLCGPHAPIFTGTKEEFLSLQKTQVPSNLIISCPHCGAQNRHIGELGTHAPCQGSVKGEYECPGYIWGWPTK